MNRLAVGLIVAMVVWTMPALAEEPIKAGFIYQMSGRTAAFGAIATQGATVAVEEVNEAGGIGGRKLVALVEDSKGDPEIAAKAFMKLAGEKGVSVVIGVQEDGVAVKLSELAKAYRVPLIITGAQTMSVTGKECNRYTFRLCPSSVQSAKVGALLATWTEAKSWNVIASDQVSSRQLWTYFKKFLGKAKPEVTFSGVENAVFVGSPNANWGLSLKKVMDSRADGILISVSGGDFIDLVKQGNSSGMFDGKRKFVVVMGSLAELLGLGRDMPKGIWWSSPYWFQASGSPVNRRFATKYEETYGAPPSWQAHFAYAAVKAYWEAAKKSGATGGMDVITALEGLKLDLPVGTVKIRAKDHQATMHAMAGKTARIGVTARKRSFRGLGSMILFRPKEIEDSGVAEECHMQ